MEAKTKVCVHVGLRK